ncbi:hypothetical protein [Clostridium butyricum]|uniref:hypothetical protein n=1 Tax=Clostridium butyricum TaxID=1492 RepID=UPI0022DF68F7|nr:hypothetical protein [Clostridium butyricum]
MLFKTDVNEKVTVLLNENESRISKIKDSINDVEMQIGEFESKITDLMDNYVSLELEGNVAALKEVDKSINSTRLKIESLKGKKEAYLRLINDDRHIQKEIPQILELARGYRKERLKQLEKKRTEKEGLNEQIKGIKKHIEEIEREIYELEFKREINIIKPLLKHIEHREVDNEEMYLNALIDNETKEQLECHLKQDRSSWVRPRVTINVDENKIQESLIRQQKAIEFREVY